MSREECVFCGGRAVKLCDFVLGFNVAGYSPCDGKRAALVGRLDDYKDGRLPYTNADAGVHTCDAPLCESCATNVGTLFTDGKVRNIDSIDLCPAHRNQLETVRVISTMRAEAMRHAAWKTLLNPAPERTTSNGQ